MALQDALKIEESPESLLNRRVKRLGHEVGSGSRNQGLDIPIQSSQINCLVLLVLRRQSRRVLFGLLMWLGQVSAADLDLLKIDSSAFGRRTALVQEVWAGAGEA